MKGDLYIKKSSSLTVKFDDQSDWTKWPIKVPDVSFMARGGATAAAGGAAAALNNARLPVSVIISFASPAAASFLDDLINTLFLLKMLEGPKVAYPDAILDSIEAIDLIPIDLGNPFSAWTSGRRDVCEPSTQLARHEVSCNLLANAGAGLLQAAGVLILPC